MHGETWRRPCGHASDMHMEWTHSHDAMLMLTFLHPMPGPHGPNADETDESQGESVVDDRLAALWAQV